MQDSLQQSFFVAHYFAVKFQLDFTASIFIALL